MPPTHRCVIPTVAESAAHKRAPKHELGACVNGFTATGSGQRRYFPLVCCLCRQLGTHNENTIITVWQPSPLSGITCTTGGTPLPSADAAGDKAFDSEREWVAVAAVDTCQTIFKFFRPPGFRRVHHRLSAAMASLRVHLAP